MNLIPFMQSRCDCTGPDHEAFTISRNYGTYSMHGNPAHGDTWGRVYLVADGLVFIGRYEKVTKGSVTGFNTYIQRGIFPTDPIIDFIPQTDGAYPVCAILHECEQALAQECAACV